MTPSRPSTNKDDKAQIIPHQRRQGRWHPTPELAKKVPLDAIPYGDRILVLLDQTGWLTGLQIAHRFCTVPITGDRKAETELARSTRAANRSLRRLKDRGWVQLVPVYLTPTPTRLRVIEVNTLTPSGVEAVRQLYAEDPARAHLQPMATGTIDPVPELLPHELAVRDALIFLSRLCEDHDLPVHWWTMETKALLASGATHLTHAPDLLMVVGERQVPLLVEVDRGTEAIQSSAVNAWATKYDRYAHYLKRDYGTDPLFEGCAKPLVLVLGESPRRLANLREAIEDWGGQRAWWFALLADLSPVTYRLPGTVWRMGTVAEPWSLAEAIGLSSRL
jgi:hypothetical protein